MSTNGQRNHPPTSVPRMRHYPLVDALFKREADSVAGPFYVAADSCIICALPLETAPTTIRWDANFLQGGCQGCPNHCRVSKQPETDEELELMIAAARGSCVEAIRYCGTDADTLQRFRDIGLPHLCDALPANQSWHAGALTTKRGGDSGRVGLHKNRPREVLSSAWPWRLLFRQAHQPRWCAVQGSNL